MWSWGSDTKYNFLPFNDQEMGYQCGSETRFFLKEYPILFLLITKVLLNALGLKRVFPLQSCPISLVCLNSILMYSFTLSHLLPVAEQGFDINSEVIDM